jgi:hypothetical protein
MSRRNAIAGHDANPDDFLSAALCDDDVARLDFMDEIPNL